MSSCNHDWSFDGHQKTSSFICNDCGTKFESEGVPDSFNVPDNIIDMLTIEVMRHGHTCTALTCYEAIKEIQSQRLKLNESIKLLEKVENDHLLYMKDRNINGLLFRTGEQLALLRKTLPLLGDK